MVQSDGSEGYEEEGLCQPGSENTGRWTSDEHRLFLKGLERYGKGWKQIATLIQTRTVVQIRTHAQKYFQKLSKAQASGNACLDPATLMSTMDAGKMRPASVTVPRNLRSTNNVPLNVIDPESRAMNLRKRRNSSRVRSHLEQSSDGTSGDDDDDDENSARRRGVSGDSSQDGGSMDIDSEPEDANATEDEVLEVEDIKGTATQVFQRINGATVRREGGGSQMHDFITGRSERVEDGSTDEDENARDMELRGQPSMLWHRRVESQAPTRARRPSSKSKTNKGVSLPLEGGAADVRALAWEAAAAKASNAAVVETNAPPGCGGDVVFGVSGGKRSRTEARSIVNRENLTISGMIKDSVSEGTRISPTSVTDINLLSFPAQHQDQDQHQDHREQQNAHYTSTTEGRGCGPAVSHQLPHHLAPSWCTKPRDTWIAPAGFDAAVDVDDAGPFRWFIDERSVSAPGVFFQAPTETWSGSDTTDVSTSLGGVTSAEEGVQGDRSTRTPLTDFSGPTAPAKITTSDLKVYNGPVEADMVSPANPAKRRCVESTPGAVGTHSSCASSTGSAIPGNLFGDAASTATAGAGAAAAAIVVPTSTPVCYATGTNEVNHDVEGDTVDGTDITGGLWVDHPQPVSSSLVDGLGLPASGTAGYALSLPSLDDDEVLGFLACDDLRSEGIGHIC